MEPEIDMAGGAARALGHLARLQHRRDQGALDELELLRPAWMRLDAWNLLLQELERECFRAEREGPVAPGPRPAPAPPGPVLAIVR